MPLIDPSPADFPGVRWSGHWIAAVPPQPPASPISFGRDVPAAAFSRNLFRRVLTLDAVPQRVPARLTADSRYVLFVNGTEVGRGPVRSQPRRLQHDTYDLAPYLRPGENVIAVLVTYYGHANSFWQPAVTYGSLGTDALLVFEARLGDAVLVSDAQWRAARSDAWTTFPASGIDGIPVEAFDARRLPEGWTGPDVDDSAWTPATVVGVSHMGGLGTSRPPTDPYGALLPRAIGALGGETVDAGDPVDDVTRPAPAWSADHPADHALQLLELDASGSGDAGSGDAGSGGPVRMLTYDVGRIVAGLVELDLTAPAGTVVDLFYREVRHEPGAASPIPAPRTAARYVARGHDDAFRAQEVNGLRFVHVVIHGSDDVHPDEVRIDALRVREYHYPWTPGASFECSDDELNALYRAGIRTVALNSFDAFTDCPTREQRAWVGDSVVHQAVHLTTNLDWRLARSYVALGNSPRPDGILPMSVVGEVEEGGSVTIPDWALHWVHAVHALYRYVGDVEEVRTALPTVERVLRWYLPYVDGRGTISDVVEWNLVDWSSVFTYGRSSILTALWARGLREFAELSRWVGNEGSAAWADGLWEAARDGFEDFWDEDRGTYVDHWLDGRQRPATSQHAGAAAIVSGLAPRERWDRILDRITDPERVVLRTWNGGVDGGFDLQKIIEHGQGSPRVDWDTTEQVVRAQPFFSYVVHDALVAAGRAAHLVDLVRDWSVFLVDGYDTFGECWTWGTPVHGWSSTPTRDLVTGVLGVTPGEPGFASVRLAPALGGLEWARGDVPTPHGLVTVRVDAQSVAVTSPVPVTYVRPSGETVALAPGSHSLPR